MRYHPCMRPVCMFVCLGFYTFEVFAQPALQSAITLSAPGDNSGLHALAVADLDANGYPDVAMITEAGTAPVFFLRSSADDASSKPDYTAVHGPELPSGTIGALILQDISGDHRPDLIVSLKDGAGVGVALNTTKGPTCTFESFRILETTATVDRLMAVDINMDGRKDILTIENDKLVCYRNNGTFGEGAAFAPAAELLTGNTVNDMKAGDLNGDGNPDIICATADGLLIFSNLTDFRADQFRFSAAMQIISASPVHALDMGDMNGDFLPEVVTAHFPSDAISVWQNVSTGNTIALHTPASITTMAAYGVAVGDVNGDGKFDMVATSNGQDSELAEVYFNTSTTGTPAFSEPFVCAHAAGMITVRDMDGDGRDDVLAGSEKGAVLYVFTAADPQAAEYVQATAAYCNEDGNAVIEWTAGRVPPGTKYIVERTLDGNVFEEMETIDAHATKTYSRTYNQSASVTAFYRIITETSDGNKKAASLQKLLPCMSIVSDFVCVFPNPVDKVMQFSFTVSEQVQMQYSIVDLNMREYLEYTEMVQPGNKTQMVAVDQLPKGSYLFVVSFGNQAPHVCRFEKR